MTQTEKTINEDDFLSIIKTKMLTIIIEKYIHHLTKYANASFLTKWYHLRKMDKYYNIFVNFNNQFNKQ